MNVKKYFGTDGIRGIVGNSPITPQFFLKLGIIIGKLLFKYSFKKIIVGKDTRISSCMLESALISGLSATGISVISVGVLPTPAVAYFSKLLNLNVGIIISASHNLFQDNGIKFFFKNSKKFPKKLEDIIEIELKKTFFYIDFLNLGSVNYTINFKKKYINYCKSTLPSNYNFKNLKIILDCANGSTYKVAPKIFEDLGANVISISINPDGYNINKNCGSTNIQKLKELVLLTNADLGIAFDGDGDRVIMVDHFGNKVNGDQILYILAKHYFQDNRLIGGVVGTKMSNQGLFLALKKIGIPLVIVNVGDHYILNKLKEKKWILGAENSGHVILLDKSPTGDGIIVSLQILKIMIDKNTTLQKLCSGIKLLPQIVINLKFNKDVKFFKHVKIQSILLNYKNFLGRHSRILLRYSGTEKCIRIMIEGKDSLKINSFSEVLINTINKIQKSEFYLTVVA